MTNSIDEIEGAGCIFIIGSNTSECHPLIARRVLRAKDRGAKVIVADPRHIQLANFADLELNHRLGTDVALLNGIMHLILKNGWHKEEYIAQRTEDFEAFKAALEDYPPERVATITGVAQDKLLEAAKLYACCPPASLLYAMGITQHSTGVDNVKSCCNMALLTGNVGVKSAGVNPLRGQNNVQGACDMGGLPNVLTGYQPVADADARARFAKAWDAEIPESPGMTITEMVEAMNEGKLRALYVIGENPKLSDPDWNHLHHALKQLDFLAVQEIFLSETAQVADVVLAASSSAEKDGTFTNTERRCMRIHKAIEPVGNSLPDWKIIMDLGNAMGHLGDYEHPREIFKEIAAVTPKSYGGMSYDRLGLDGLAWPCPTPDHPGTAYLHKGTFARGKGKFHAVQFKAPAESPDEEYPLLLTTGRMFAHFHFGTMTRVCSQLDREQSTGYVEINPEDAAVLDLEDGEVVVINSRRGEMEVPARITDSVPPGTLFLPIHFGENPTNVLTSSESHDPLAKIPEFKVNAVRIAKLG